MSEETVPEREEATAPAGPAASETAAEPAAPVASEMPVAPAAPVATASATAPPAPRAMRLLGIHHVTAISRDLEATTRFYRDTLGLTLVRATTNDDDPTARHFWFGDPSGTPGTLMSFLEYPSMGEGTVGTGSTHHVAFAVGSTAELDAWHDYLTSRGAAPTEILERGGLRSIYVRDPDGHIVEITAAA